MFDVLQPFPSSLVAAKSQILDKVVEIPPHGIPLHPKSIENLLSLGQSDTTVIVFRPRLPVSSELGLPSYPILAYLYPRELSSIWTALKTKDRNSSPI